MAEPTPVPNPAPGTADGRTVLLVGGTDGHVEAFDRLGARIVLAQHPDKVTAYQTRTAHALLMVDYTDWETLLPFARAAQRVYGCEVVASLTEGGLTPAARLTDLFGIGDGRRHEVSRRMRDKQLMREHLAAAAVGPEVLAAEVTDGESLARFGERAGYPFVVKPTGTTAGFGVAKVRDAADVERVRHHIEGLRGARTDRGSTLFRVTGFLAEEYLNGAEFSVEAFSFAGSHRVLAVTEKLVDDGHFAELGHALPARLPSDDHARVVAAVEDHLTAMGVVEGPSHTEVRLSDRGPVVIESHNRMGGDFIIELLAAATGIDLPAWSAARALGLMEEPARIPPPFGGACVRFLTGGDGVVAAVHGADDVASLPEVITTAVSVAPGSRTRRPRDNWDRLGHVAVRAPDTDTAVARCEQLAHREIRIETR
ncbi:ATP-grasp domain-containing protein [Streptomyces sp. ventii]|uniref:ATP-grasp domain-containing protein n=2 Tax=Streptomyces spiramenti TaxID=2720606 RepID=A0ABX1AGD3_9ACTN|nr:ATP-grasp domain-containing protein [Streptomyces spiramenti]